MKVCSWIICLCIIIMILISVCWVRCLLSICGLWFVIGICLCGLVMIFLGRLCFGGCGSSWVMCLSGCG